MVYIIIILILIYLLIGVYTSLHLAIENVERLSSTTYQKDKLFLMTIAVIIWPYIWYVLIKNTRKVKTKLKSK